MRVILAISCIIVLCCVVGLTIVGIYTLAPKAPYCQLAEDDPHGIHLEYAAPKE